MSEKEEIVQKCDDTFEDFKILIQNEQKLPKDISMNNKYDINMFKTKPNK
jgi:hypothetical protein